MQLHGVMLRRSKDDVLALPPKLRTWLPVDVPSGTGARAIKKVFELLAGKDTQARAVAGRRASTPRQAARLPGRGTSGARRSPRPRPRSTSSGARSIRAKR